MVYVEIKTRRVLNIALQLFLYRFLCVNSQISLVKIYGMIVYSRRVCPDGLSMQNKKKKDQNRVTLYVYYVLVIVPKELKNVRERNKNFGFIYKFCITIVS